MQKLNEQPYSQLPPGNVPSRISDLPDAPRSHAGPEQTPSGYGPLSIGAAVLGGGNIASVAPGSNAENQHRAVARAVAEDYFDRSMATASIQDMHSGWDKEKTEHYKSVFSETAIRLFDDEVLSRTGNSKSGSNPLLGELISMVASIDRNAGVYYSETDVKGIFNIVADSFFDNSELQQQMRDGTLTARQAINMKGRAISSVDSEISLALIKTEAGEWKTVDREQYRQSNDFRPLEVARQDNPDKGGSNKYRFRSPVYTRNKDSMHRKQVAEGWYTSEWSEDPNYWSARMRETLTKVAGAVSEQLAQTNTSVVFTTEGGVYKGTATANTDLDTECHVVCDTQQDFDAAHQVVRTSLAAPEVHFPFPVKDGGMSGVGVFYYDRSTGKCFYRDDETGSYHVFAAGEVDDNNVLKTVNAYEKGTLVTTANNVVLFKKLPIAVDKDVRIAISAASGTARQIGDKLTEPGGQSTHNVGTMDIV